MANLKEIRNSIASVSSTKQITSAMKMVSAAKLRKAQDAVIKMRPYANKLQEVLSEVCGNLDGAGENVLMKHRDIKSVLIIIITSNNRFFQQSSIIHFFRIFSAYNDRYNRIFISKI